MCASVYRKSWMCASLENNLIFCPNSTLPDSILTIRPNQDHAVRRGIVPESQQST